MKFHFLLAQQTTYDSFVYIAKSNIFMIRWKQKKDGWRIKIVAETTLDALSQKDVGHLTRW